jgi:hypothetical protein
LMEPVRSLASAIFSRERRHSRQNETFCRKPQNIRAHCKNEPLKPGERVLIDERLNIHSRASTHFFPLPGSGF